MIFLLASTHALLRGYVEEDHRAPNTMEIVCRKRTQTDVWHICVDCTAWPTRNYTEKWVELTSVDPSTICIQCLQRKREGQCRMCGPGAMYDLEISSAKLSSVDLATRCRAVMKILWPSLLLSVPRKKNRDTSRGSLCVQSSPGQSF